MNIRGKLRRLLLVTTLLPLLLSSGMFLILLSGLGTHLASDTKNFLIEQSHNHLNALIQNAVLLVQKNLQFVDWVLSAQARNVEIKLGDAGFIQGSSEVTLSSIQMKELGLVFSELREDAPSLISSQYLSFTSGRSYSLTANNLEIDMVDLSGQQWLDKTIQKRSITRNLIRDKYNHSLKLIIAAPLKGLPLSVTAVETCLEKLLAPIASSETLHPAAKMMLASIDRNSKTVSVIAELDDDRLWQFRSQPSVIDPSLKEVSAKIAAEVSSGRSGVLEAKYRDGRRHWAYGKLLWGQYFPLVMLEHDHVIGFALESEQHVLGKIRLGVFFVGIALLVFVGLSVFAAQYFSKTVTAPVRKLSQAFDWLAKGDFRTRVSINSGDEMETLGHTFNDLGEKLEDRSRMANSLTLAREVQQKLLPKCPPVIAGIDLFSQGLPCDEVGGDYFDYIYRADKSENQLGIAVGDVSGHGVPAALLMASARGILRSHAWCHGGDLTFLFRLLNQHLSIDSAYDQFMTLFYGVLDREEGTLSWNSAGHGPVLFFNIRNEILRELETTGPPLGIDDDICYEPQSMDNLQPGDILLAATDGLWECQGPDGEMWGIDNVRNALLEVTSESASVIGETLLSKLELFRCGQKQEDDISIVVAKLT